MESSTDKQWQTPQRNDAKDLLLAKALRKLVYGLHYIRAEIGALMAHVCSDGSWHLIT